MSDNLFVNRNNTTYQVDMENLRSIEDTDLLLVNRNGTTYTVTGDKVSGGGDLTQVNLAPLSGTPDFEVTATTDLSGILPESTINYQWYRYTASTGGTGTLLQELTSDSAILDTYTTTAADQGNYIGCTVTYLGTTITETARTQCLVAPGPVATMHGLRFDPDRETSLTGQSGPVNVNDFTFSCWVKRTGTAWGVLFYSSTPSAASTNGMTRFKFETDSTIFIENGGANFKTTETIPQNVWTNIVISVEGYGSVRVYINGVESTYTGSNQIDSYTVFDSPGVGTNNDGSEILPGYLSEVYLVEQVLPPEVFGKNFEPYGWGPLDSSQIKENIGDAVIQPYDYTG